MQGSETCWTEGQQRQAEEVKSWATRQQVAVYSDVKEKYWFCTSICSNKTMTMTDIQSACLFFMLTHNST